MAKLTKAPDYAGRLSLHRGEFIEHGGKLSAVVYVQPNTDVAVVDATGADPNTTETAKLYLWQPRSAKAVSDKTMAALSETWKDSTEMGASGQMFGSMVAITVEARDVHASIDSPLSVTLSFHPKTDGSFRLLIRVPEWKGGNAVRRAKELFAGNRSISPSQHQNWWKDFWEHSGVIKLTSGDGSAKYFENLRCLDLYTAAAESLGPISGSQAGIRDLFSSMRNQHRWGPSAFWHWNLRMQVAGNIGAGLFRFNDSYFHLYRSNLNSVETWTKEQMKGRPGVCMPETMRFNGPGYENATWLKEPGVNCSAEVRPYYNARTLSTGAEVSLWIWQQFLATQDKAFLRTNYPVMAASARFLLAYARVGSDGLLHTYPSNAHETQWDVHDPTTNVSAMRALFPVVVKAAQILDTGRDLVSQLQSAIPKLPAIPRAGATPETEIIAPSYDNNAPTHNSENMGLEPVWRWCINPNKGQAGALVGLFIGAVARSACRAGSCN